ncbi:hypothetical protein [Streptomyces rochei]|uniref:hypothetical protein n=1 Tax=Streptomyces rochei TaxID=1928 RepID=UPI0002EEE0B2
MRRFRRRFARHWRLLVERARHGVARVRGNKNYGRAKRVSLYVFELMVAPIVVDAMTWLLQHLHGR